MRPTITVSGGGGALTAALFADYVDSSGTFQQTEVVDGVTSISGVAPFLVKFRGYDTRSTELDGDDAEGGFRHIGYRFNYGEALGTTWSYPDGFSYSKDEDTGPPISYRAFRTAGTYTVRMKAKDSADNEDTVSLTVVVAASSTLTTVNIPVSDGAWPTWVSSRRYTLDAGGDYSSFGAIDIRSLHNIVIEKTGSGADPIVSECKFDGRVYYNSAVTRTAHVRLVNIDCGGHHGYPVGFDFCGYIGGRCRNMGFESTTFYWQDRCSLGTRAEADSVRYARGLFFWECGEINEQDPATYGSYDYVVPAPVIHSMCFYGVNLRHRTQMTNMTIAEHNIRGSWGETVWRYCKIENDLPRGSWVKGTGHTKPDHGAPDPWHADMLVGDYDTQIALGTVNGYPGGMYGVPGQRSFFHNVQFHDSGSTYPSAYIGFGPQNNDNDGTSEACELCGYEDCVIYGTGSGGGANFTGLNLFMRNVRLEMGTGAYVGMTSTGSGSIKTSPGYDTGYLDEDANTRPVPSAFA